MEKKTGTCHHHRVTGIKKEKVIKLEVYKAEAQFPKEKNIGI